MSCIYQLKNGKKILYCKGADDVIMARLDPNENMNLYRNMLDVYGTKGLRTLCFSYRYIENEEYKQWKPKWEKANLSIQNREQAIMDVCELIEKNLIMSGITGIEDKLQDLVPETIQLLRDGNIKIWMLTGDKYQTAVEISRSCNLINVNDKVYNIVGINEIGIYTQLDELHTMIEDTKTSNNKQKFCIVIDGQALAICLATHGTLFGVVACEAISVVCCRGILKFKIFDNHLYCVLI
jgi:magnesium-transporting ATPase (P-type)